VRVRKTLQVWQWGPVIFLLLGALSLVMLIATHLIGEGLRMTFAMTDAVEGVIIRTTTAHLWLEQANAGDARVDMRTVWADLDHADKVVDAILNGGETEHGMVLKPLKDPGLRTRVEELKSLLAGFRALAVQRHEAPKGSGTIPELDRRIDEVFIEFQDKATSLEIAFEKTQAYNKTRSVYLFGGILTVWLFVIAGATTGLWNRERRRRETEDALRQSEKRYRTLFERAGDAIFIMEAEGENAGRIVAANRVAAAMHGYNVDEIVGLNISHFNAGNSALLLPDHIRSILDGEWIEAEVAHRRKDGATFPCEMRAGLLDIGDHKYILAFDRDITLRKKTEEELKSHREKLEEMVLDRTIELVAANARLREEISERRQTEESLKESESSFRSLSQEFSTILEAVTDPLTLISPDLKVIWRNRSSVSVTGKDISDPAGRYCYTLWHNRSTPCEGCPVVKSLASKREESSRIESPKGKLWELRAFPIKDERAEVSGVLTVASDITEKTNLEAKARRIAHLASLGELAAGVAHEINNPINGIINFAQILANKSKAGSRENDIANSIIKEGDRIANIVKSLLSFARAGRTERNPARIHEILADSLALTSAQIRKDGITLNVHISPDLPEILAHPQQIQQVFLNIINNSRYALNQKFSGVHKDKVLRILAEKVRVDGRPYIRLTFHDQGIGIPSDIIDKVMNPFFTTKPGGKGTGLGLSISHGIIADHGGKLDIDSVEGEFTRVSIELPVAEEKKEEEKKKK
jgi:two-component system NtrC family sensor kinase